MSWAWTVLELISTPTAAHASEIFIGPAPAKTVRGYSSGFRDVKFGHLLPRFRKSPLPLHNAARSRPQIRFRPDSMCFHQWGCRAGKGIEMKVRIAMVVSMLMVLLQPSPTQADPKPEMEPEQTRIDAKAARAAKLSLADAIAAAEKHTPGTQVLEARFEREGSVAAYVLRTYRDHEVWEGKLDANSGALLGPGTTTPESRL